MHAQMPAGVYGAVLTLALLGRYHITIKTHVFQQQAQALHMLRLAS